MPHSREFSFRKGIVIVSFAVETENDISSIRVWIPYRDKDIDALNKKSHLPADLGLFYSVMINPNFKYFGKNTTSRRYAATLRPSTNLTDTAVSGDEATPSPVLDENARKAND